MTRAGIVAVAGRPNAGKSTLLNRFVGEKLAITSPKPQSTRRRIVGIVSRDDVQFIFHDTPGLLHPRYALHSAMRGEALAALQDADVIAYLVDGSKGPVEPLHQVAALDAVPRAPIVTVVNKADLLSPDARRTILERTPDVHFISAETGEGVRELEETLKGYLPESPFLYDAEEISTQSTRFFVAEFIRETALELLEDEVPYSVACEVEEFREDRDPLYIRALIYVERDSQKRILIGHHGAQIREIGRIARLKVEAFLGCRVYLDLWVKVLENWRRDTTALRRFGFVIPEDTSK
jgi:GTP-binding protein Era